LDTFRIWSHINGASESHPQILKEKFERTNLDKEIIQNHS